MSRESVRRQQRKRDRRVEVADHRVRQPVRINLPPAHRLGRRRPGEAAGVWPRICDLQKVIVALFVDPQNLLDLRLCLQHEVFWTSSAQDHHRTLTSAPLGVENDRSRLVHVLIRIEHQLVTVESERRDVHSYRAVARRRRIDRHARRIRCREQRFLPDAEHLLALAYVFAGEIVKLRTRHRPLEFLAGNNFSEERVGRQQHIVIEENVINADDAFFAQNDIGFLCVAAVHRESKPEMGVVIQVRTGRDDPVDESSFDQGNERRHSQASRRQRPSD